MTFNLTFVTLEMRSRSNLPIKSVEHGHIVGVDLHNWLANVKIQAYINKSNLTSNLTSVTLEMRLRSNLPI